MDVYVPLDARHLRWDCIRHVSGYRATRDSAWTFNHKETPFSETEEASRMTKGAPKRAPFVIYVLK